MKLTLNLFYCVVIIYLGLTSLISCRSNNQYSKKHHLYTDLIADRLYIEGYQIESYGVGGDVYSIYLTDSLSFRKFISLYYDNESFNYNIDKDEVVIIKKEESGGVNMPKFKKKIIEEYKFSLKKLKEKKEFE